MIHRAWVRGLVRDYWPSLVDLWAVAEAFGEPQAVEQNLFVVRE